MTYWTENEISTLKQAREAGMSNADIAKLLPGRNRNQIKHKVASLKSAGLQLKPMPVINYNIIPPKQKRRDAMPKNIVHEYIDTKPRHSDILEPSCIKPPTLAQLMGRR